MSTVDIEVTFPKKVSYIHERDRYKLETFTFKADASKNMWEQSCDAFEEACRRGHNPNKNIRMHWLEGSPLKDADGQNIDVAITCPDGRKKNSLRAQK